MKFNKLKQRYYDNDSGKWKTLRIYFACFNTRKAGNLISLQLPAAEYEKTWTLIPTFTYHHDPSIIPGPSFTLQFKWLKWSISFQVTQYLKSTLDEELAEEETADNNE